jgi:ubiquitin-conjugating enzyme E2 O
VLISLPSSRLVRVPISACSLYRDIEDYQWDAESAAGDDIGALFDNDDHMSVGSWELEVVEERDDWGHMEAESLGHPQHIPPNPGQLKAFSQAQTVMPGSFDPRPPTPLSDDDDQITRVSSSPSEGKLKSSTSKLSSSIEEVAMLLEDTQSQPTNGETSVSEEDLQTNWKRFEVLPEAPPDHAFFSVDPPQLSKQFLSRLAKEYRVLESTLPETILVRAYEDRADLLRSLIIGPQNTPYQDAPFVIDWRLDGSFPQTPPIAHFLSWTNGNGRVNP